ncbi:E3 ubiquitin-protein ligase PRT1 [Euphorbia lathyris]|uniref:E3 ubiquitin-protein ligase PRT1 n=1 Tax=Euphorbia lathyris TaxID=212925 RepID=UPI0033141FD3
MAKDISTGASTEMEEISDSFTCSICLDLLYKPVVLSCGHVSCFWCVHKSMDSIHESHCPICRHPYYHFPTISWTLHLLLLKLYPIAYRIREEQILEEEKEMEFFSPQFDSNAHESHSHKEHDLSDHLHPSCTISKCNSLSKPCSTGNEEPKGSCKQLAVTDVECTSCKQVLFHPVFLNCGHGYCETCISCPVVEMLKCQVCQSPHPAGLPKICLELDQFLEKQFPRDYALRREAVQLKQVQIKNENSTENSTAKNTSCSTKASKKGFRFSSGTNEEFSPSKIHLGVGCDYCGMYPIIGDRYKCEDCFEKIGFDLCGDCYNTNSKRPGRFNQQHTPEHKFVQKDAEYLCIPPDQLEDFQIAITSYIGPPINIPEDESQDSPTHANANENDGSC